MVEGKLPIMRATLETLKPKAVLLIFVFCLSIVMLGTLTLGNSQVSSQYQAPRVVVQAYIALKNASDAGANVSDLASRFNSALSVIDKQNMISTSGTESPASLQEMQAESSINSIIPPAQELAAKDTASQQTQTQRKPLMMGVEALAVAIAVVSILIIRRHVQSKQFRELIVKVEQS
jgi:hypothetical protein